MTANGYHLTSLGRGRFLLEPSAAGMDIGQKDMLLEEILGRLQRARGSCLYYDLSGLSLIDPVYYGWMDALARACRTINVKMVCVQMQPTAAYALAHFLQASPSFETALDVASHDVAENQGA